MWKQKDYITVVVFNLAEDITKDQVKEFFIKHIVDSEPIVHHLVQKRDKSKTTTVTIKGGNKQLKERIKAFKKPGFNKNPLNDAAGFSHSFLGLTPLYESSVEPPLFDVYFVHGLNGHAFNTWASNPDHHAHVCMWPRDILPHFLERKREGAEELYGRYSVFGYEAGIQSGSEIEQSIPETAKSLMNAIAASRAGTVPDNTPIFLVCHSLGGLVACQAVVNTITSRNAPRENFEQSLNDRFFHERHQKCLVRGIVFFGTPFEGSKLANIAPIVGPVIGLRAGKGSFISALRVKDRQVQSIIKQFDKVRKEVQNRIRLLIFYEKKEVGLGMVKTMVTEKSSALSTFEDKVEQQSLLLDHRNIVKFISESDRDFQQFVGPLIINMIRSGLAEMGEFDAQYREPMNLGRALDRKPDLATKIAQIVPEPDEHETVEFNPAFQSNLYGGHKNFNNAPRSMLYRFGRSSEVEKVLAVLLEGIANPDNTLLVRKQIEHVKSPIGDTCNWILHQTLYQNWEQGNAHNILFFTGIEGSGKSVLAKYIINRIAETQHQAVIASFFCRSVGVTTTPANILRHVILQLEKQNPDLLLRSLFDQQILSFAGRFDVDVLWSLFRAMCEKIGSRVFVVVDGLDECLQNIRLRRSDATNSSDPVNQFLGKLYSLMSTSNIQMPSSGSSEASSSSRIGICFLTRPQDQVNAMIEGKDCSISIEPIQVQKRAARVIEAEVKRLVEEEKLPPNLEALVRENLLTKAKETPKSAFQWANTAVERMQNQAKSATENLNAIRPGLYPIYTDVLTQVSAGTDASELASFLLRTLAFAQEDFTFDMLDVAFRFILNPEVVEKETESTRKSFREIANSLRGVVDVDDDLVRLSHESVRDFLLQLSSNEWPLFSCIDKMQGHMEMASMCLKFLIRWHRDSLPLEASEDIDAWYVVTTLEQVLDALQSKSYFEYAIKFWGLHVRESGELSSQLLNLLGHYLQEEGKSYNLAMALEDWSDGLDFDLCRRINRPIFVLVRENLFHTLRRVSVKDVGQPAQRSRSVLNRFRPSVFRKSSAEQHRNFDFNLDVNERNRYEQSLLHVAAGNGAHGIVKYLLDHGAKGNVIDVIGDTPFSLAVKQNQVSIAEMLIGRGQAFEREPDERHPTSLLMASSSNMENVVKHLLKAGMDPNARYSESQWTALHAAAFDGHVAVVELLLSQGADVRCVTSKNMTALHLAAFEGHTQVCRKLLQAKPSLNVSAKDDNGESAIYMAAMSGSADTVKFLLSKGAIMEPEKFNGFSPIHIAALNGHRSVIEIMANSDNIHLKGQLMQQPIHLAAAQGHTQIVKALITLGADPNARMRDVHDLESDSLIWTPVALAIQDGHEHTVRFLLTLEVEIREFKTFQNQSLLHFAAHGGSLSIAKILIDQYGLDPFQQADDGKSPFYEAVSSGKTPMATMFWDSSDPSSRIIDVKDDWGYTPLLAAAQNCGKEAVDICLRRGADTRARDNLGRNAIDLLVRFATSHQVNQLEILKTLVESGASVLNRDSKGRTPIHAATASGMVRLIIHFLENGADVNALSDGGDTPLHLAASARNREAASLLIDWEADPFLINKLGLTPIDYLGPNDLIFGLPSSKKLLESYSPLKTEERNQRIKDCIKKELTRQLYLHVWSNRSLDELQWSLDFAKLLFLVHREDDVRIAQEHLFTRRTDSVNFYRANCIKCEKVNQRGPVWICRDCRPVFVSICNRCYRKRDDGDVVRGCSVDHSHMEVAGQHFNELEYGTVRKDGLTIIQWRNNLRKEFDVEIPQSEQEVES